MTNFVLSYILSQYRHKLIDLCLSTADINYNATVKELVFTETVRNVCSTVIILRDHVVTNDTVFAVHLASEDSAVELPQPDILVWISDRDGKTVCSLD